MADEPEQQQAPAPEPPTQGQIEERLGNFEFESPQQPQQPQQEPQNEPQQEAPEEQGQQEPPPSLEPDDPEIDWNGRKYKTSELKRGLDQYRQQFTDFQRKQQAFAQQQTGFTQHQQQAAEMLRNAVQLVEAYMPRKPDPKLAETDPFAYQSQRANYEAALEKLEATRQNERNFREQTRQQEHYRYQQYIANQANATLQKLPELRDPVKFAKWSEELKSYATAKGYTPQDLVHVRDYRLIDILNDGIKLRRMRRPTRASKPSSRPNRPRDLPHLFNSRNVGGPLPPCSPTICALL